MALVRNFIKIMPKNKSHPTEVDAEWCVVESETFKLLQISTFGSDSRQSQPKVSQTLQFDKNSAAILKKAIEQIFPDL